jgi:hypothetical protein
MQQRAQEQQQQQQQHLSPEMAKYAQALAGKRWRQRADEVAAAASAGAASRRGSAWADGPAANAWQVCLVAFATCPTFLPRMAVPEHIVQKHKVYVNVPILQDNAIRHVKADSPPAAALE